MLYHWLIDSSGTSHTNLLGICVTLFQRIEWLAKNLLRTPDINFLAPPYIRKSVNLTDIFFVVKNYMKEGPRVSMWIVSAFTQRQTIIRNLKYSCIMCIYKDASIILGSSYWVDKYTHSCTYSDTHDNLTIYTIATATATLHLLYTHTHIHRLSIQ